MTASFLKESADGVYLSVKLQPRASREQIAGIYGSELKMSVTAPPVDAAANRALIEFIVKLLDRSRAQVTLVRGQTSPHKTLFISGIKAGEILEKLKPYCPDL